MKKNTSEDFWAKVDRSGDCWVWTGVRIQSGYGRFTSSGKQLLAHRYAYAMEVGEIPAGMEIDHICLNRGCVRPEHLRVVTRKQNTEHRAGSQGASGVRGVSWHKKTGRWQARVRHGGVLHHAGTFDDLGEAERAARALRLALFTHNDLDRLA